MTRVRGFTQDDAHLFMTAEQVNDIVAYLHSIPAVENEIPANQCP